MKSLRITFWIVAAVGLVADLWTKSWFFGHTLYSDGAEHWIWQPVLSIQLSTNPGAVWGILHGKTDLLTIFSVIAIGVIVAILFREKDPSKTFQLTLGLIVSGAMGNLYDRWTAAEVRDFIVVYLGSYRWPTFNIADSAICVGVGMFLIRELFFAPGEEATDDAKATAQKG